MDAFVGEIRPFAFGWAPADWLLCNGASLQIAQYQVLCAVIGTLYGSTDNNHFNLPNLQGYALVGSGKSTASGITYPVAAKTGTEGIVLSQNQMPYHTHTFNGSIGGGPSRKNVPLDTSYYITNFGYHASATATTFTPANGYVTDSPNTYLNLNSVSVAGGTNGITASHENRQPFLAIGYYICYNGYFPSRP